MSNDSSVNGRQIEPSEALAIRGATFPALLIQPGNDPNKQKVVEGMLMVDTGALATCVDQNAAERAGLQVVDSGPVSSVTHANQVVPIYSGIIEIVGSGISVTCNRAYGVNLGQQGIIALVGRDLLKLSVLIYNGPDGSYSLSM